jgi:hypothetical protein
MNQKDLQQGNVYVIQVLATLATKQMTKKTIFHLQQHLQILSYDAI